MKTLNVHHAFCNISLPSRHDYNLKLPKFTFNGGRELKTTIFVFKLKYSPLGFKSRKIHQYLTT